MKTDLIESTIDWLKDLGYNYASGLKIAFDGAVCVPASLWDTLLPKLMRGDVRVKA